MNLSKYLRASIFISTLAFLSFSQAGMGASCPDPRMTYTPKNDVQFIDYFQPHHMMAIEMGNELLERGESAELRMMAQKMIRSQTAEIQKLRSARKALTGRSASPHLMDQHMMADMKHMKTLSGKQLDAHFIDHMIPHHASALPAAHQSLRYLKRAELKEMANMIVMEQAKEIGDLQKMRE